MKFQGLSGLKDPLLINLFNQLEACFNSLERDYGIVLTLPGNSRVRAAGPPFATLKSVTGVDGKIVIQIENPSDSSGPIFHEISTASVTPFGVATDILTYGPDIRTMWEITDPNVTKYVRLRSRYINSDFNRPIISQAVYSGLLRSSSLSQKNTELTPVGTAPILTQEGTTKQINIASSTWRGAADSETITYPAGSVTVSDFGLYYIYGDDPKKDGTLTNGYQATTDPADLKASDARVTFGFLTLAEIGGGVGGSPDVTAGAGSSNGPGAAAGTAVLRDDGVSLSAIETLAMGDSILGLAGSGETLGDPEIIADLPTFAIQTSLGFALTASSETQILLGSGSKAIQDCVAGDPILVRSGGADVVDNIVAASFSGMATVYRLHPTSIGAAVCGGIWVQF